jgi:hypothetical protein|tara:strand:+ start:366 stop:506 length:141 start_codon:yes stop_codon:yes gene_type:complete
VELVVVEMVEWDPIHLLQQEVLIPEVVVEQVEVLLVIRLEVMEGQA